MSDDLRKAHIASALRGEMVRAVVAALQKQNNTLGIGETVKLGGSVVPYLLSSDASVKIPADLDIAIDSTLIPRGGKQAIQMLVQKSAADCGYGFQAITRTDNEHCAIIAHDFSPKEIQDILAKSPLKDAIGPLAPEDGALTVTLPVHYVTCPVNLFPPQPYDTKAAAGKLKPFLRENILDIFALKLARVILGNNATGLYATDMLDIARIMDNDGLRKEALQINEKGQPDAELLRMLVVTWIATLTEIQKDRSVLDKSQARLKEDHNIRFSFTPEDSEEFKDALRKKGSLIPGDEEIKRILATMDGLMEKLFPERKTNSGIPLIADEKEFIQNAIAPDRGKCSYDNIHMDLLTAAHPDIFKRYPHLQKAIQESPSLNEALDRHGARIEIT